MQIIKNVVSAIVVTAGLVAFSTLAGAATGGIITFNGRVVEDTCRASLASLSAERAQLTGCRSHIAQAAQTRVLTGVDGRLQLPSAVAQMIDDVNPALDVVSVQYR